MTPNGTIKTNGFSKLSWLQRFGFGSGDLAQNLIYQTISMYLLFFYTNVYGLHPADAATMFLVVRLVDVLWDPLVGTYVDKHNPRMGKYRSYLIMGKYIARGLDKENLVLIPLVLAGYARYLKGVKDDLTPFEPSPDPMLEELQAIVAPLEVGKADQDYSCLKQLYTRRDVFGLDLYEAGLGEQIEGMVRELFAGKGAVRKTLHKYVIAR